MAPHWEKEENVGTQALSLSHTNPPKYEIMRIVSAALPQVSLSNGGGRPRRRRRGARRESSRTRRVSVVVLRTNNTHACEQTTTQHLTALTPKHVPSGASSSLVRT